MRGGGGGGVFWLSIKDADLTGSSFLQEKVDSNLILDFLQDNALWESSVLFPLNFSCKPTSYGNTFISLCF